MRRHNLTGGWAVRWGLVGGLVSGVAMTASCASVEGNDGGGCAAFGAGAAAVWALVGFLAAPSLEASSQLSLDPESARLKPYARLPAGLPKGVAPASLEAGPARAEVSNILAGARCYGSTRSGRSSPRVTGERGGPTGWAPAA